MRFVQGQVYRNKRIEDVVFEVIGALPTTKGYKLIGNWINIVSSTPYIQAIDNIRVRKEDYKDWEVYVPENLQ